MSIFLKVIASILTAVILWLFVSKECKGFAALLSLAVCSMVIAISLGIFQPIFEFVHRLQMLGDIDEELLEVLLKVVGIGMLTEFTVMICKDAGNEAIAKTLQIFSTIVILRVSIPIFDIFISLLDDILGTI